MCIRDRCKHIINYANYAFFFYISVQFANYLMSVVFGTQVTYITVSYTHLMCIRDRSCIRGAEIIARVGDDIILKGSLDYLGAVRHSGGCYDNSLVARYDSLTASSNTEMIDIFSQILKRCV